MQQEMSPADQELVIKLTRQFKTPIHTSIGEVSEFIQNSTTGLIHQIVTLNRQVKTASTENQKLKEENQKLKEELDSLKNPKKK